MENDDQNLYECLNGVCLIVVIFLNATLQNGKQLNYDEDLLNTTCAVCEIKLWRAVVLKTWKGHGHWIWRQLYLLSTALCRSQWQCGLRRGSAAAHRVRLWVRIPSATWLFVDCECCVLWGRSLCD